MKSTDAPSQDGAYQKWPSLLGRGEIKYSVDEEKWTCAIFGYKAGPWGRTRIDGHVASTQGYAERIHNERWNIQRAEQRNRQEKDNRDRNKRTDAPGWGVRTGKIRKNEEEEGDMEMQQLQLRSKQPEVLCTHTSPGCIANYYWGCPLPIPPHAPGKCE